MPFKPGKSGNPNGRPRGYISPATKLRHSIYEAMPEILLKMIELAKQGDTSAAKILIDRVCSPLKAQALPIKIPLADSLTAQGGEIIRATMTGQIAPDIGAKLIQALADQSRLAEFEDLVQRIERLENEAS